MATNSGIPNCLGNPFERGAWWSTVQGVTIVRHNLVTKQQQKILRQWTSFHAPICCLHVFFEKMLTQILCPFLQIEFPIVELYEYIIRLEYWPHMGYKICKYFLNSSTLTFSFHYFFFHYEEQKLLFVVQSLSHGQLFVTPWTAPSSFPGSCSDSCPLSWWCHLTILSSIVPFSSCLQSFPASGSFLMSQFFSSGSQSIGASASASVLPINTQISFSFSKVNPKGWLFSFRKKHIFNFTDLCWQSNVSAF